MLTFDHTQVKMSYIWIHTSNCLQGPHFIRNQQERYVGKW